MMNHIKNLICLILILLAYWPIKAQSNYGQDSIGNAALISRIQQLEHKTEYNQFENQLQRLLSDIKIYNLEVDAQRISLYVSIIDNNCDIAVAKYNPKLLEGLKKHLKSNNELYQTTTDFFMLSHALGKWSDNEIDNLKALCEIIDGHLEKAHLLLEQLELVMNWYESKAKRLSRK